MLPKLDQKGVSQIILPLFLLAAIGLSVYLVQQRTNIIPFAQNTGSISVPNGCQQVTLGSGNRYVAFKNSSEDSIEPKKSSGPEYEQFGRNSNFEGKKGEELRTKEFKDVVYKFSVNGKEWQYTIRRKVNPDDAQKEEAGRDSFFKVTNWDQYYKCENLGYDANKNACLTKSPDEIPEYGGGYNPSAPVPKNGIFPLATMSHFDRGTMVYTSVKDPNGEKFEQRGTGNDRQIVGGGDYVPSTYDNGRVVIYTKYVTGGSGQNDGGVPNLIGTANQASYYGATFPQVVQRTTDQIVAVVPTDPANDNIKCTTGSTNNTTNNLLDNGASCGRDNQCKSNDCAAGKCAGGTQAAGSNCTANNQCASNSCVSGKCATSQGTGSGSSPSPRASGSASPSPSPSASASAGASTSPTASVSPAASAGASPAPSASVGPGGTIPISLTKTEIIGFKSSYDALSQRLPASASGNLRIVSTLANNELTSIINELPTCPDDASVGQCIDAKFRTRFDLAKTAARLTAFYAVFNDIPGICVKADLGLNPLFTATSANNTTGRVNLCNDRLVPQKIWMIFSGGAFTPILSTDTKFRPSPTCATLPTDVITHYRNAEKLFKNQPGFVENTFCDGKTSVAGGND